MAHFEYVGEAVADPSGQLVIGGFAGEPHGRYSVSVDRDGVIVLRPIERPAPISETPPRRPRYAVIELPDVTRGRTGVQLPVV